MKTYLKIFREVSAEFRKNNKHWKSYKQSLPVEQIEDLGYNPSATSRLQNILGIKYYSEIVKSYSINPHDQYLRNMDYGGGLFNKGKSTFRKMGVISQVYDKFSRTMIHNEKVKGSFEKNKADTVTIFNVLNTVQENIQIDILKDAWKYLKKDGLMMITLYYESGMDRGFRGKGERVTWQEGKPLKEYIEIVKIATGKVPVIYKSKIIVVQK